MEESNVSFFNDSSLGDFVFEETDSEVGGNKAVEDAAVDGPALSEKVEKEVDADKIGEGSRPEGEEAPSKEGAMEDHERETEEEEAMGDGKPSDKLSGMLDLKASEYFTKYPKAIANPQVCNFKTLYKFVFPPGEISKAFQRGCRGSA